MKKTGELKHKMGLLILLQNINKIEERCEKCQKSFFNPHIEKRWNFLWYNNDNNLKPRRLSKPYSLQICYL